MVRNSASRPDDADDDALVERQAGDAVLVGVGLPQMQLRQLRRAQFGDIGDGRAGIERQPEHVGVGAFHALGRKALARGDGGNARRAEVRPDHPGADEAEMRRLDQPLDLFAGIVGEREDDPVRARSLFLGAHLDAADDAVRARRRRDEQAIPHRIVAFDRLGEVDHLGVERDPHRFNGFGRAQARRERGKQDQMARDPMAKLMRCARQDWFACGMDRPGPDGSSLEEETNSQLSTRVTDHSSRF